MPACGQLLRHLTTGFGQPCGVRWTPPGCPHHPTHDGGCVSPASYQSQPIKGGRPTVLRLRKPESAAINSQALTGGPYLNIELGRSGLSKPCGCYCKRLCG